MPRCENEEKRRRKKKNDEQEGTRAEGAERTKRRGEEKKKRREKEREGGREVKRPARKNEPLAVLSRALARAHEEKGARNELPAPLSRYLYGHAGEGGGSAIEFRGRKRTCEGSRPRPTTKPVPSAEGKKRGLSLSLSRGDNFLLTWRDFS